MGFAFDTLEEVLEQAKRSAEVTHDHPEGIKGAQAVASAVFLARTGQGKDHIQAYVETTFGYDLGTPLDEIRETYEFDVSCQGSVPQAIRAFLESERLRGRHPPGDLHRRGQRHDRLHGGRDRPGVLRRRARRRSAIGSTRSSTSPWPTSPASSPRRSAALEPSGR